MLKLPLINNQRNPQWASELLGYNTQSVYNLGNYSCLISCLGMLTNRNTHDVNELLKANKGFQAQFDVNGKVIPGTGTGNFVWSKCTVLGLNSIYVSPTWSGPVTDTGISNVKSYIDQGYAPLCEVDFNPSTMGEEMHFVLAVGYDGDNFMIADPWTGTIKSMDVYGGFRRAIIQFRVYDKKFPTDSISSPDLEGLLSACVKDRNSHWDFIISVAKKLNIETNETVILAELDKLIGYEDGIVKKDKQLQEAQKQIDDLKIQLNDVTTSHDALQTSYDALQKSFNEDTNTIADLKIKLTDLESIINAPRIKGWVDKLRAIFKIIKG